VASRDDRVGILTATKILLGCAGVVTTLSVASVVLNWDRLTSAYRRNTAMLSQLQTVRTTIQTEYDTSSVSVVTKKLLRQPKRSALLERILSVELMNPPFLKALPEDEFANKAREIAQAARNACPSSAEFDAIEIILTSRTGVFVTVGNRRHFVFRSEELSSIENPL
jgi:hypothetical protein